MAVACITARVQVAEHDAALWREIEAAAARFRGMAMDQRRKFPSIRALRDAYRALGNDPTRYRGSNEALVRRITQGKTLYRVNTVVDINNLISLETLHWRNVRPRVAPAAGRLSRRPARRKLLGHWPGRIKIAGLPVFADQHGPFGSTTSDSQRVMIRLETTRMMMVVISFRGPQPLDEALQRALALLEDMPGPVMSRPL